MDVKASNKLKEARSSLNKELKQLAKASGELLEPLKKLDDSQIASLAAFGQILNVLGTSRQHGLGLDKASLKSLTQSLIEICPPMQEFELSRGGCLDAEIAYVSALSRCRDEDPPKTEEECPEAWGYGGQAAMCHLDQLIEMKRNLGELWNRQKPPRPFPWPY